VNSRSDDIRKRIAKRKKEKERKEKFSPSRVKWAADEEKYGFGSQVASFDAGRQEENHPLFKKEVFLFKILASAFLFLLVAILFKNHNSMFDTAKSTIKKSMNEEFQFAAVSDWYEQKFGKPLALLPVPGKKENKDTALNEPEYALPAAGKILDKFEKNGQGIMIETGKGDPVKAMNEGIVRFAGVKEGIGKTVIIQHSDKTESWYGNLENIKVSLYEYIEKGKEVGTVSPSKGEDSTKGEFYFAIKKGEDFIDPIQVIRFE